MGRESEHMNHLDTMELAMVAEFLNSGRNHVYPGLPRLLSHLAACRDCRAEVMELADVLHIRGERYHGFSSRLP